MKNRFQNDYERVGAGDYRYVGKFYTLPMDEKKKKKSSLINWIFVLLIGAAEVTAGLLNADSSRILWLMIPYIILFLPTAYMAIGAGTYLSVPVRMEHSAYENSLLRMKRSCIGIMILAGVNIALDGLYIMLNLKSMVHIRAEMCYIGCMVWIIVAGVLFGIAYDRLYTGIQVD